MGYKIDYSASIAEDLPPGKPARLWVWSIGFLLLLTAVVQSGGFLPLQELLFPPKEAVDTLIADLESGEGIGEAVSTFWQELMYGT